MSYRSELESIIDDRLSRGGRVKFRVSGDWVDVLSRLSSGEYDTLVGEIVLDQADIAAVISYDGDIFSLYSTALDTDTPRCNVNVNEKHYTAPTFMFHYNKYRLAYDF